MLLRPQWLPHDDLGQQVGRQTHEVAQLGSVAMERGRQDPQLVSLAPGCVSLLSLLHVARGTEWRLHDIQVSLVSY